MSATAQINYGPSAWFYEAATNIYSGGQIRACKASQLEELKVHDSVLYVGAGSGEDVVMAARRGLKVTAIELSDAMIARMKDAVKKAGVEDQVTLICGDAFDHDRKGYYDAVAANFFLNIFTEDVMLKMMAHLTTLLKPYGKLMIADFAPLAGHPLVKAAQWVYHGAAQATFVILANNPWHPIYDYPAYFSRCGLALQNDIKKGLAKIGPKWYRTVTAVRTDV